MVMFNSSASLPEGIFFDVRVTYLIVADRIDRIDRTKKFFRRRDFLAFNLPLPSGKLAELLK